jgi:hypothetical protein
VESAMTMIENNTENELDIHCMYDLHKKQLEDFWQHFAKGLAGNDFLIRLKCTNFSPKGITAMAEALKLNSSVTSLMIAHTFYIIDYAFEQEGIFTVANLLKVS